MSVRHDLRQGWRTFFAMPGVTLAAVLSLALGIGANTAIFSVASPLLLRPLPYADPASLTILWNRSPGLGIVEDWFSTAQYFDVRDSATFADVALAIGANDNLIVDGQPERIGTIRVSSNLLPMLGVRPLLLDPGRPGDPALSSMLRRFDLEAAQSGVGDPFPADAIGPTTIDRLRPTITNTFEVGYKGILTDRLLVAADVWSSTITDFVGPLRVETPSVFFNPASVQAFLAAVAIVLLVVHLASSTAFFVAVRTVVARELRVDLHPIALALLLAHPTLATHASVALTDTLAVLDPVGGLPGREGYVELLLFNARAVANATRRQTP